MKSADGEERMKKLTKRLLTTVGAVLLASGAGLAAAGDRHEVSVVLTGQSLLQSDIRAQDAAAAATIRPLLTGDVVFTNFETTVKQREDSLADLDPVGGVYAPPEA